MFGPLGFPEVVFILILALLIFGPKRLPEVGRTIGKGVAQFRRATTDLKRTIESEIALEEEPVRPAHRPAALPAPRPLPAPAIVATAEPSSPEPVNPESAASAPAADPSSRNDTP
jgi:TatA/E family protein of Tat protein translocase